jgi:hypothetical protein
MLLETAELAAYISGTLAALIYVLDTCYPFCIKKCFPVKINENGNPITNKNKERDKTNSKGKKTLLRSKIKDMMKEDSERIKKQMKNNKSQHINIKNKEFGNNTSKTGNNSGMNINTNEADIFSIQAFELQLGGAGPGSGIGKEKGISKRVSRYNNIQHSRKINRHRRHSSMFTRNKYRRDRDSLKNSRSSSSLNNYRNRNPFSPIKKCNSYDKYFGESDDSKHELTSLFEDIDLIELNDDDISSEKNKDKKKATNTIFSLPKIVIQPSSNNNDLLLPDNKDVLYRNINDIKSDNSIYNTLNESDREELLNLKKTKTKTKTKSHSYSSIYSTDTDDANGDADYLDVFQTSKSL